MPMPRIGCSLNNEMPSFIYSTRIQAEFFLVVSGHGLIQERKIGSDEAMEFEVSGEKLEPVHMLPGYTHNIINLSETDNLVTLMWANELLDKNRPDTFHEEV